MDRLKIRHINILTISLVGLLNIFTGIIKNWNYERYIYYTVPFLIGLFICIFVKSYKLDAWLFLILSELCILVGNWGNLTGAVFLCFSFYCFEYKQIMFLILGLTIITIVLKFLFLIRDGTFTQMMNYIIGYLYVIIIYYILIHPKKYFSLKKEDAVNINILNLMMQGYKNREIADKIGISDNAIVKRIDKMRDKYNCGNNVQLICNFLKTGEIRQK